MINFSIYCLKAKCISSTKRTLFFLQKYYNMAMMSFQRSVIENVSSVNSSINASVLADRNNSNTVNLLQAFLNLDLYWWCPQANMVATIGPPFILFFGVVGNILSFATMLRKNLRRLSAATYLTALALADTASLIFGLGLKWLKVLTMGRLDLAVRLNCKLTTFMYYLSGHMSSSLLVAVTAERFLITFFPFRARAWCTVTRARIFVVVCTIFFISVNSHLFWTTTTSIYTFSGQSFDTCTCLEPFCEFWLLQWPVVDAVIYSMLPLASITLLNLLISLKMLYSKWKLRVQVAPAANPVAPHTNGTSGTAPPIVLQTSAASKYARRTTIVLLVVSTSFLLMVGPVTIISFSWGNLVAEVLAGRLEMCSLVDRITSNGVWNYVNHAINFYIYCLSGQTFRREVVGMLRGAVSRVFRRQNPEPTQSQASFGL